MAANKSAKTATTTEAEGISAVTPLASIVGKTAGELWKIFVMRYVAKGVAEIFSAIVISAVSLRLLGTTTLWLFAPGFLITVLIFDAIQLLVNPRYFALGDVMERIKQEQKPGMTIYQKS